MASADARDEFELDAIFRYRTRLRMRRYANASSTRWLNLHFKFTSDRIDADDRPLPGATRRFQGKSLRAKHRCGPAPESAQPSARVGSLHDLLVLTTRCRILTCTKPMDMFAWAGCRMHSATESSHIRTGRFEPADKMARALAQRFQNRPGSSQLTGQDL